MTSKMVERVARAIAGELHGMLKCEPNGVVMATVARAAIKAMREPTDAIFDAVNRNGFEGGQEYFDSDWRAAIDAALESE